MNTLCAKCGACSTVCPVFRVSGREELSPRGRLHLLGKMSAPPHSATYLRIVSSCLLCGACRQACPRDIDLPDLVAEARRNLPRSGGAGSFSRFLVNRCLAHPTLLSTLADLLKISAPLLRQLPADSGLRLKLGLLLEPHADSGNRPLPVPRSLPAPDGIAIFSGCLARHLLPEIDRATRELLAGTGHAAPYTPPGQTCCGLAAYSAGNRREARRLARSNLDAFGCDNSPIVASCGSCYAHLITYPDLLADDSEYHPRALAFVARLREISSFLADSRITTVPVTRTDRPRKLRVFYHDPCHLRFKSGLREAPRRLLRDRPYLELLELPGGPRCCGLGGTFNLAHPELSQCIADELVGKIRDLGPDLVLTSCSGCLLQLHRQIALIDENIEVKHLADFLNGTQST